MKYKLVYLEWEDATHKGGTWESLEGVIEWGKKRSMFIKEVGWVIEENDKYILLVTRQTMNSKWDDDFETPIYYGGAFKIPKTWIRKRKVLKP